MKDNAIEHLAGIPGGLAFNLITGSGKDSGSDFSSARHLSICKAVIDPNSS